MKADRTIEFIKHKKGDSVLLVFDKDICKVKFQHNGSNMRLYFESLKKYWDELTEKEKKTKLDKLFDELPFVVLFNNKNLKKLFEKTNAYENKLFKYYLNNKDNIQDYYVVPKTKEWGDTYLYLLPNTKNKNFDEIISILTRIHPYQKMIDEIEKDALFKNLFSKQLKDNKIYRLKDVLKYLESKYNQIYQLMLKDAISKLDDVEKWDDEHHKIVSSFEVRIDGREYGISIPLYVDGLNFDRDGFSQPILLLPKCIKYIGKISENPVKEFENLFVEFKNESKKIFGNKLEKLEWFYSPFEKRVVINMFLRIGKKRYVFKVSFENKGGYVYEYIYFGKEGNKKEEVLKLAYTDVSEIIKDVKTVNKLKDKVKTFTEFKKYKSKIPHIWFYLGKECGLRFVYLFEEKEVIDFVKLLYKFVKNLFNFNEDYYYITYNNYFGKIDKNFETILKIFKDEGDDEDEILKRIDFKKTYMFFRYIREKKLINDISIKSILYILKMLNFELFKLKNIKSLKDYCKFLDKNYSKEVKAINTKFESVYFDEIKGIKNKTDVGLYCYELSIPFYHKGKLYIFVFELLVYKKEI